MSRYAEATPAASTATYTTSITLLGSNTIAVIEEGSMTTSTCIKSTNGDGLAFVTVYGGSGSGSSQAVTTIGFDMRSWTTQTGWRPTDGWVQGDYYDGRTTSTSSTTTTTPPTTPAPATTKTSTSSNSHSNRVQIGLGIGLGATFLIIFIISGCYFLCRRSTRLACLLKKPWKKIKTNRDTNTEKEKPESVELGVEDESLQELPTKFNMVEMSAQQVLVEMCAQQALAELPSGSPVELEAGSWGEEVFEACGEGVSWEGLKGVGG